MLSVASMGSTPTPSWTGDYQLPSITLPDPAKSVYATSRQKSEPAVSTTASRECLSSLKRPVPSPSYAGPESRNIQAMAPGKGDPYTNYLLSQDLPENPAKRAKLATNPWFDLKGTTPSHSVGGSDTRKTSSYSESPQPMAASIPKWSPIPAEAGRPKDLSKLYATAHYDKCKVCDEARYIAPALAKSAKYLDQQLRQVAKTRSGFAEQTPGLDSAGKPIPEDFLGALSFSMERLNESIKTTKEMLSTMNLVDEGRPKALRSPWDDDRSIAQASRMSTPSSDDGRRQNERETSRDPFPQSIISRSPPYRQLPSPSSSKYAGSHHSVALNTAPLHDFQHQQNARSQTQSILQAEHEKLLTTYSRLQAKCTSLEKKTLSTDSDLALAIEDRAALQVQVEALEQQVSSLQTSHDEAQKQSAANASQYMQIMTMSSKLQAQSAADLKKFKIDREIWVGEKEVLEKKIVALEKAQGTALIFSTTLANASALEKSGDIEEKAVTDESELAGMSFDRLKEEILTLRRTVREAGKVIQVMRDEGSAITRLTSELGAAGERLVRLGVVPESSEGEAGAAMKVKG